MDHQRASSTRRATATATASSTSSSQQQRYNHDKPGRSTSRPTRRLQHLNNHPPDNEHGADNDGHHLEPVRVPPQQQTPATPPVDEFSEFLVLPMTRVAGGGGSASGSASGGIGSGGGGGDPSAGPPPPPPPGINDDEGNGMVAEVAVDQQSLQQPRRPDGNNDHDDNDMSATESATATATATTTTTSSGKGF